jgi:endo-1,4-beta-xylanase
LTAARQDHTWHTTLPHRFGEVSVAVLGADGQPLSSREVIVEQRAHAFSFGNIGFDFISVANGETDPPRTAFGGASPDQAARIADLWFDVFNTATLPF